MAAKEVVTLDEAQKRVKALDRLKVPDHQPCVEALSLGIHFSPDFDTNFGDKDAYLTSVAKYKEQALVQGELSQILEEGQGYSVVLYTWRSCSRAIPQVKSNDQVNRSGLNQTIKEILEPEVEKLLQLMSFQKKAIDRMCVEVERLCCEGAKHDFVSKTYLLTLGKMLNMFAELNELSNYKSSTCNDHTFYKRAAGIVRGAEQREAMLNLENLSMHLATKNKIRDTLKSRLMEIQGYDELIADVINYCLTMYEQEMYLEPSEKFMLIKVMAFGLFLMDVENGSNFYRIIGKKKINLAKIDKIFKHMEFVPLYGDIMIRPYDFVNYRKSPNFESSKWPECESSHRSGQSNLLGSLEIIKEQHMNYTTQLSSFCGHPVSKEQKLSSSKQTERDLNFTKLAKQGLKLLSQWTQKVLEVYSWKLKNPTDNQTNSDCPEDAEDYEKATRYNYTSEEKFAMVEIIAMIKGLQLLIARHETAFKDGIHRHIHTELQKFAQIFLREPLQKATKNKSQQIRIIIISVRETCADWLKGVEPPDDPALKGKKDPKDGFPIEIRQRNVGPSSTQLYLVHTMLESLVDDNAGSKKSMRKAMKEEHVTAIEEFLHKSLHWPHLLNFNASLFNCCDLSQLWFREISLELTMGTRVQFPIEMSMPWILTDHILETKSPSMMEYILYPLDLYNDSAEHALMHFKKKFLYDEVEAEVDLCFDQLVYKLSDQIFAYYKHLAGSIMLDKRFRAECQKAGEKISYPVANRYETLMKLRNVQLLGRNIDLNKLISQFVNATLQRSIDVALSRFECGDITGIIELECLLEVNRLAHKLMGEYLLLNDFDAMLKEANQDVNSPYGRITLHVFYELNMDFLPNYCYNAATNRFVRTLSFMVTAVEREKAPSVSAHYVWGSKRLNHSFSTIFSLYSDFIGAPHFSAIYRLLGYQGLAVVVDELLKTVEGYLHGSIYEYVKTLMSVMPQECKLIRYDYTSPGVLGYYQSMLAGLMQYSDLRIEAFQKFKLLGNAVLFCLLMEQALKAQEVSCLNLAALFHQVAKSSSSVKSEVSDEKSSETKAKQEEKQRELKKRADLNVLLVIEKFGSQMQTSNAKDGDQLTRQGMCLGRCIFDFVLKRIGEFLTEPIWHGETPTNGVMNVDSCSEFHRLWSAIQFVYCIPGGEHEYTIEELFGEGLNWAGCVLITALGQQQRFQALDFCYHLVKVNTVDMINDNSKGVDLLKMVNRIRKFQVLNNQIFSVLNNHLVASGRETYPKKNVKSFMPPV